MNGRIGLISMPGIEEFSTKVNFYLRQWNHTDDDSFEIKCLFPRFATGDGKAVLQDSVRGRDIYIISDPYNYSVTYTMRNTINHMSPDDHIQNIKRVLSAINGKAKRTSVIMTMLYGSRQHARSSRESLDCAVTLRELEYLGVDNIITFDAHDPKVQNAVPMSSFDNLYPNYQMIKSMVKNIDDIIFSPSKTIIVSTDPGGVQRCLKFAEALNLDIGMFYKRRDTKNVINGTNPIIEHEFIGHDIAGKDVIIVDDVFSSGDSLIDAFIQLKKRKVKRIFSFVTFGMFANGYSRFDEAFDNHLFDKIFVSNLTYRDQVEVLRPWLITVDLSKYAAYIIDSINKDISISAVLDPMTKIRKLLESRTSIQEG